MRGKYAERARSKRDADLRLSAARADLERTRARAAEADRLRTSLAQAQARIRDLERQVATTCSPEVERLREVEKANAVRVARTDAEYRACLIRFGEALGEIGLHVPLDDFRKALGPFLLATTSFADHIDAGLPESIRRLLATKQFQDQYDLTSIGRKDRRKTRRKDARQLAQKGVEVVLRLRSMEGPDALRAHIKALPITAEIIECRLAEVSS